MLASSAGSALGLLFLFLIWLAFVAVWLVGAWKTWEKMGDPGWMGIVPFLNAYRVWQRTRPDQAVLFTVLSIVPCISFVMAVILWIDLGKLFGKSFVYGLITPLIGFTDVQYIGPPPPHL